MKTLPIVFMTPFSLLLLFGLISLIKAAIENEAGARDICKFLSFSLMLVFFFIGLVMLTI